MAGCHVSSDFILSITSLIYMIYFVLWGRKACRQLGRKTTEILTIPHQNPKEKKRKEVIQDGVKIRGRVWRV
jgi:hypothetical protein